MALAGRALVQSADGYHHRRDGKPFTLQPPKPRSEVPAASLSSSGDLYIAPPEDSSDITLTVGSKQRAARSR